ncbi:MAG: hypothetical protein GY708_16150 [Actinomycetia bacterium]|nr:hypothetical protein [Actinomycetes bacterium]MCP4959339.1 hypothetical protein [Actinomycetes bacterium]
MARRRRYLFACTVCDAALVWPSEELVKDDPHSSCMYTVDDGFHIHSVDSLGRPTVILHPDRMWRLTVDPSGRARCPDGHPVGAATTGQNPPPWFIALWTDKVTPREMRGPV